jgi:hypothetical protein
MTEDEAKLRWCPYARKKMRASTVVNVGEAMSGGVYRTASDEHNCLGSGCMAWRWAERVFKEDGSLGNEPDSGYCGLAGKP